MQTEIMTRDSDVDKDPANAAVPSKRVSRFETHLIITQWLLSAVRLFRKERCMVFTFISQCWYDRNNINSSCGAHTGI